MASVTQTSISFRHIFGANANVSDNLSFCDDDTIVYVAGQCIVQYNRIEKRQRFAHAHEITDVITAFSSGCGKRIAAVAERGERPQIHVFDLKQQRRKKTFAPTESTSKEYISIQFSDDEQLLLTLTGGPLQQLTCWNWYKAKAVATSQVSSTGALLKCSFNPIDTSVSCLIGKEIVKFYRIIDKDIRILRENVIEGCNYISHCWMRAPDDHVIAGTDTGILSLFRSGELLYHLTVSPGSQYPINSLITVNGGFMVGSKPGVFLYFTYTAAVDNNLENSQFSRVYAINTDLSFGAVIGMALNPADDTLCAITSDSQIVTFPAITLGSLTSEQITSAVTSFHGGKSIVGLDVCARKPLIVTCAKDNTVRLWNIKTHDLELQKNFPEEMYSVAMHPTGLQIAIGFIDKLRIYHVLVDELRLCLELSIKGCRECRFSRGGHALAIANGNAILVIDFYTGEKIADLRGHNSKVRCLFWMETGCHLLSCGQDGAVYLWDLRDSKRVGEFVQKGTMYTSVSSGGDTVLVVGNDRMVRELSYPDLAPAKFVDAQGLVLTQVSISQSKGVLFAGTGEYGRPGNVRAYAYPLSGDCDEYPCMGGQVTRMRLTPDQNFLIVADDMGCLVVFELKERQERFNRQNNALPDLLTVEDWSDEVLVTRAELDERSNMIAELKTKVEELQLHNEYQLKLKDMHYVEKIKEETDSNMQILEQQKSKWDLLKEENEDYKVEYCEKIRQMGEKHEHDVQEVETRYQAQIMALVDAYQQLSRERDAQIERLEDQRRQLVNAHERYVDELTREFEKKLDEDHSTKVSLELEKHDLEKELGETQKQLEDDVDTEIDNMRKHFEEKLSQGREMTLKYKGENGIMKKKFGVKTREIEEQKDQIRNLLEREKDLHEQIKLLEREVTAHKKEIKTRDISIGEKEKKIYELKKKNQELDKFKFVLDFKIRELKHQIEPRQLEIMRMRDQIKKMDQELEQYHRSNSSLDELIGVLRARIDALQATMKSKRLHAGKQEVAIERFRSDLQMTIAVILDPIPLKEAVLRMIEAHGSTETLKPRIDPDVEAEYNRHREFLRKSVKQLHASLEQGADEHMNANNSVMSANLGLIEEINKQKDANKILKQQVQAKIGQLRHMIQATNARRDRENSPVLGLPAVTVPMSGTVPSSDSRGISTSGDDQNRSNVPSVDASDPRGLLEMRKARILALKTAIAELENRTMSKAYSKEVLPPMEGTMPMSASSSNLGISNSAKSFGEPSGEGIALPPLK